MCRFRFSTVSAFALNMEASKLSLRPESWPRVRIGPDLDGWSGSHGGSIVGSSDLAAALARTLSLLRGLGLILSHDG